MALTELLLITLFLVKHFVADWMLQSSEMAAKKGTDLMWLAKHCGIHVAATAVVLLPFLTLPTIVGILLTEFIVHFATDWFKARPAMAQKYPMPTHNFWVLIGADQLAHQLFYLSLTWWIMMYAA